MNIPNHLKLLRFAVSLAFLAGILFSRELWFPLDREIPRAPVFADLPENFAAPAEWLLSAALVLGLILLNFLRRTRIFSLLAVGSLTALIALDQTRLQPWVYQYGLLLVVFSLGNCGKTDEAESNHPLALAQTIIAALYFWSGVQKLNYAFARETLPFLLAPLGDFLSPNDLPLAFLGIVVALVEASIGVGLLWRKSRNLAVCLATAMHAVVLILLIARDYNQIVWIWNAALILIVFAAFWRSDFSIFKAMRAAGDWRMNLAKAIALAAVLLPVLNFWGWWDSYLAGALYSGNVETAVVRINDDLFEKLPPKAQRSVFQVKSRGEKMLPQRSLAGCVNSRATKIGSS